ncbi:MAG: hypothetical protein EBR09_02120 [Proteobacteria bacterium]|nr:hypothetical protein [Pseudomonadota bacterium]
MSGFSLKNLMTFLFTISPSAALAQFASVVPEGVMAVIATHRTYTPQDKTWNEKGVRIPQSSRAKLTFDGEHLLRGEGGAKLQSLAEELKRYDDALARKLNLGTLNVGGSGKLNIQYFGLAIGLPRATTVFFAAPIADLSVNTRFALTGQNNAAAIRDELGDLAYTELKDGLGKASQLSERDVKASIEAAGYTGVDSWRYRNFADLIFGLTTEHLSPDNIDSTGLRYSLQSELFASAPTGHTDHPDVLSDVSIGTGAWGLGLALSPAVSSDSFAAGLDANVTGYLPSSQTMRIPLSDETIISSSRKTKVQIQTGLSWEVTGHLQWKADWFQPQYRMIFKKHERDTLSGQLAGNYRSLMNSTGQTKYGHALWLYFSTIDMFKRDEFPIPLRLKIAASQILKGFNSFDESFIELQLISFLPTPWMRD